MTLKLLDDNEQYGKESIELTDKRRVDVIKEGDHRFPLGLDGLIPVITQRSKGPDRVVYAFPLGETDRLRSYNNVKVDGYNDKSNSQVEHEYNELDTAIDLLNRLLAQAAELSKHPFGYVNGIRIAIPNNGYGFTHVEHVPVDAHGDPSETPIHLCIETSKRPGACDSLSAVLEYNLQGSIQKVLMTEYGDDGYHCTAIANINEKSGKLSIYKVEESDINRPSKLLYKRGWQHTRATTTEKEGYRPSKKQPFKPNVSHRH